jgi:hypothetical protein
VSEADFRDVIKASYVVAQELQRKEHPVIEAIKGSGTQGQGQMLLPVFLSMMVTVIP